MKKLVLSVIFVFSSLLFSQKIIDTRKMYVFMGDNIELEIKGKTVKPGFTPGNHNPDEFLSFTKEDKNYISSLPFHKKGMSSIKTEGNINIYNISSGYVPEDLKKPLDIEVDIPEGNTLI